MHMSLSNAASVLEHLNAVCVGRSLTSSAGLPRELKVFILLYRFSFSQWDIGRSPPRVGLSVLFCDSFRTLSVSLPFALGFISPWLFIWSFLKFLLKVLDL